MGELDRGEDGYVVENLWLGRAGRQLVASPTKWAEMSYGALWILGLAGADDGRVNAEAEKRSKAEIFEVLRWGATATGATKRAEGWRSQDATLTATLYLWNGSAKFGPAMRSQYT